MKARNYSSVKKENKSTLDSDVAKYLGNPQKIYREEREIYLSGSKSKTAKKSLLTRDINSLKKYYSYLRNKKDLANAKMTNAYDLGEVINERKLKIELTRIKVLEKIRKELD